MVQKRPEAYGNNDRSCDHDTRTASNSVKQQPCGIMHSMDTDDDDDEFLKISHECILAYFLPSQNSGLLYSGHLGTNI